MAAPTHAGALGLLGILKLTVGRADEAVPLLTQAMKGMPRDAMLLGGLGLAQLMRGDAAGAEESLRRALKWGNRDDALLHMRLGMALDAQGRTAEAIVELRRALTLAPNNIDVLLNLANALAKSGQGAEAEKGLRRVLEQQPGHGSAQYNLGVLYTQLGRLDEAAAEFHALLRRYPESADAHNHLGIVLERQLQLEQAATSYRKALALDARHVSAMNNLGNVLRTQGHFDEAAAYYAQAMQLAPAHADGYLHMGMLRASQDRLDEARALFQQALALDPQCVEAAINMGEIHRKSGALADATQAFRQALRIDASNTAALNGLGALLRMQGHLYEAADCFSRAIRAAPADPKGLLNLGMLRGQQGQYEEACALMRQVLKVDKDFMPAYLRLAEILKVSGRLDEARDAYGQYLTLRPEDAAAAAGLAHVRQHLCEWDDIEPLWERVRGAIRNGEDVGVTPFSMLSMPSTPSEQQACARTWAHREFGWIGNQPVRGADVAMAPRTRNAPLRLGYLSWDYHEHATAYLMAEVFELHNRDRCRVTAYSLGPDDDSAIRRRIRSACDDFVDMAALPDVAAAQRIADDGIDVLIDLKGYTLGARTSILAYRPAPVQVNWLGYPGTMGTGCVDWILADSFVIPEGADQYYDERVYRLPDCYQPNDRKREIAETPTRAECGIPEAGVVFCCFNQPYKILPEIFCAWMRILNRVPGSVLWLLETNDIAMRNLRASAMAQGVAAERIIFAPHRPLATHLARYRVADLALDTFPYTSHTTASDALWAGCPLIARVGDTFASRVSGSILHAAHMPELATATIDEFESLAVGMALDPARRVVLRQRLHETRMSLPLFNTPRFVENLEQAFAFIRQ